ncbi:hypothetical protein OPT61_g10587 [Boeremia exigua]|uniref:Uncharacterized protein n=1 Tax=Boeremia exigua TaxID=749465 RepID=A0ACC2HP63_9PLEO|nr:hypothetical protein OPT61_g10587 [Boeremia exigua]
MAEAETVPIVTQGLDPTSGTSHSESDSPVHGTWGSKDGSISNSEWNDTEANKLPEKVEQLEKKGEIADTPLQARKKVVVVGLGMVGIAFIEKLMKYDVKRREYDIVVIGEEPHLAYNRVGLTSFFQHRKVENLYLNPVEWYSSMPEGSLNYHLNTLVTEIDSASKTVKTSSGETVPYDILVLATGSDALLPRHTPGHDAEGVGLTAR